MCVGQGVDAKGVEGAGVGGAWFQKLCTPAVHPRTVKQTPANLREVQGVRGAWQWGARGTHTALLFQHLRGVRYCRTRRDQGVGGAGAGRRSGPRPPPNNCTQPSPRAKHMNRFTTHCMHMEIPCPAHTHFLPPQPCCAYSPARYSLDAECSAPLGGCLLKVLGNTARVHRTRRCPIGGTGRHWQVLAGLPGTGGFPLNPKP